MSIKYNSVATGTDSTLGNPRQRTYMVLKYGDTGWTMYEKTSSIVEVQRIVKDYLSTGGTSANINRIAVAELVPIDFIMIPQV